MLGISEAFVSMKAMIEQSAGRFNLYVEFKVSYVCY